MGNKFVAMDLEWNYEKETVRLSVENYIMTVLQRFQYKLPKRPQHSPASYQAPAYGSIKQYAPDEDKSELFTPDGIKRIVGIDGAMLYYARVVGNKLLVALGIIVTQVHSVTTTGKIVKHLLDYVATFQNDGIIYRKSNM